MRLRPNSFLLKNSEEGASSSRFLGNNSIMTVFRYFGSCNFEATTNTVDALASVFCIFA